MIIQQLEKKRYTPPGGYHPAADEDDGGGLGQDVSANAHGADITRRPSKRQLEKAPEGRSPRMPPSANGHNTGGDSPTRAAPAPDLEGNGRHGEEPHSRFREEL